MPRHRAEKFDNLTRIHWLELRKACFKRDHYTCMRCDYHNGQGRGLSAHHIKPRPDGIDELDNLITLCNSCHDFIEDQAYTNLTEIKHAGWELQLKKTQEMIDQEIEDNPMITETIYDPKLAGLSLANHNKLWHSWVYGGQRNPQLNSNT